MTSSSSSATQAFSVTWDYRCPFARNANEHLVTALQDGAPWEVTFLPFSLSQIHAEDEGESVWDDPEESANLLALEVGVVVRDRFPDQFLSVHRALFAARHDDGGDLRDEETLSSVLKSCDVNPEDVLLETRRGWPREIVRESHERAVREFDVFGVPTFIVGGDAVFVRLMNRPLKDAGLARSTIDSVLELIATQPNLNEFKHTRVAR
ncbi:MAG: DsbA family protein [Actinobacteria bacterium]|nr:DsbA family protein [Actinomycetota bacterium]